MSYLNQAQDPKRRAAALTGTIAVHAALGFAIVTGLTIAGYQKDREFTPTFEFEDEKPPEPEPAPSQPAQQKSEVTSPLPPLDLRPTDSAIDPVIADTAADEIAYVPDQLPTLRPDPPRPAFTPRKVSPSNDPNRWITTADYPANPLRNEVEGTSGYRVVVGTNGRVASCEIVRPSGNGQLDGATCRHITQRARFEPATDETGGKVVGTYSGSVKWEIPD